MKKHKRNLFFSREHKWAPNSHAKGGKKTIETWNYKASRAVKEIGEKEKPILTNTPSKPVIGLVVCSSIYMSPSFFPKASPMLGFSFSDSAGAERDEASIFVDGRWAWTGLWMEDGGARYGRVDGRETGGGDGHVDGRCRAAIREGGRAWTGLWMEDGGGMDGAVDGRWRGDVT